MSIEKKITNKALAGLIPGMAPEKKPEPETKSYDWRNYGGNTSSSYRSPAQIRSSISDDYEDDDLRGERPSWMTRQPTRRSLADRYDPRTGTFNDDISDIGREPKSKPYEPKFDFTDDDSVPMGRTGSNKRFPIRDRQAEGSVVEIEVNDTASESLLTHVEFEKLALACVKAVADILDGANIVLKKNAHAVMKSHIYDAMDATLREECLHKHDRFYIPLRREAEESSTDVMPVQAKAED